MAERGTWRARTEMTVATATLGGAAWLGYTEVAEYADRGYSKEKVEELQQKIERFDEAALKVIGQDNECQMSIYSFLRSTNDFPTEQQAIRETLTRTCSDVPSAYVNTEVTSKEFLLENYIEEISDLNSQLDEQDDRRIVSGVERMTYAAAAAVAGGMAMLLVAGAVETFSRKK